MAKRSGSPTKKPTSPKTRGPRAYPHIPTRYTLRVRVPRLPLVAPLPVRKALAGPLVDRRQWHPERWDRPLAAVPRSAARVVVKDSATPQRRLPAQLAFSDPRKLLVCHKRKERREVILALGKGGGGNRPPKRNRWSNISC